MVRMKILFLSGQQSAAIHVSTVLRVSYTLGACVNQPIMGLWAARSRLPVGKPMGCSSLAYIHWDVFHDGRPTGMPKMPIVGTQNWQPAHGRPTMAATARLARDSDPKCNKSLPLYACTSDPML